jgi:AraC-like DNA-binding protein
MPRRHGRLARESACAFDDLLRQVVSDDGSPLSCHSDTPEHAVLIPLGPGQHGSFGEPLSKLLLVRRGMVALTGPHGRWSIVPGHMVYLPAGRPYIMAGSPGATIVVLHLRAEGICWLHGGCWVARVPPLAAELAECALRWNSQRPAADRSANAVFAAVGQLCPEWFTGKRILWTPFPASAELRRAVEFAHGHIETASLAGAAQAARISSRTLRRRFREEMGMSWRDFIQEIRMGRAIELLAKEKLTVTETAMSIGFSSVGAFSAAFAAYTGTPPSRFMRRL